jgi:putative PEP-CTERM system histidine kinase
VRGFLALSPPRAPRDLGWEDYALLATAGRQVASYLAEDAAARELAGARQIDGFNRRFAFVVHDVKNMASQIQLILGNAERHAGDPAFVADMIATLRGLSARMAALIGMLGADGDARAGAQPPVGSFEPAAALRMLAGDWPAGRVVVPPEQPALRAAGDARRFRDALAHLVQNAVEASAMSAPVELRVEARGAQVAIVVADHGDGMDARFLREELFSPLRTTKPAGSGLGAFQARALLAEMGGALAVESAPGVGTTVTILLPRAEAP